MTRHLMLTFIPLSSILRFTDRLKKKIAETTRMTVVSTRNDKTSLVDNRPGYDEHKLNAKT